MSSRTSKSQRRQARALKAVRRAGRRLERKTEFMASLDASGFEEFRCQAIEWLNRAVARDPSLLQEDGQWPEPTAISTLLAIELAPSRSVLEQSLIVLKNWAGEAPSRQPLVQSLSALLARFAA